MSLRFNAGSGGEATAADNTEFEVLDKVSVLTWIKPLVATPAAICELVKKWKNPNPNKEYRLIWRTDGAVRFMVQTGGTQTDVTSTGTLNNGVWQHVAGVYDGANIHIYINGVSDATPVSKTGNLNAGDEPFRIADDEGIILEDARMYNRALTANEVLTIYAAQGTDGIVNGMKARVLGNEKHPTATATGADSVRNSAATQLHLTPAATTLYEEALIRYRRRV